jgi:hypothetical protein
MASVPVLSAQLAVLDPGHPDGFQLSQATELHGVSALSTIPGPAGDDVGMSFVAGTAYADPANPCANFVAPALPLYGSLVTNYSVTTNGRLTWPTSDTGYVPTPAAAQAGVGTLGCWQDLSTSVAGNTTVDATGTVFTVSYVGVGFHFGGATNTFSIAIDTSTGVITLNGLSGLGVSARAADNLFIGASPGGGATDPGMAAFGAGGSGAAVAPTDMIYRFGPTGALVAAGANTVVLTPNGSGNYTWVSY